MHRAAENDHNAMRSKQAPRSGSLAQRQTHWLAKIASKKRAPLEAALACLLRSFAVFFTF